MKGNRMEAELVFRALGDARRIQILDMLMEKEMNAGEILERVDVVQSTLSHHMKSLCDSGLVASRRDGKWTYYAVQSGTVREAAKFLERFFAPAAAKNTEETGEAAPAAPAPAAPVRAEKPAKEAKAEKPAKEAKPEKPAKEAKAEKPVKEEKAEKPEKKKQSGSLGEDIFDEPAPAAESTAKKSGRKADKADKAGKAGKADKKAGRDEGKKKPKEEDDARESVYASMKEKTKKKKADKQGKAEKKKGSKKAGKK